MRRILRSNRVRRRSSTQGGQSLVEFALVLTPLFMILLGIIQFGFIFNAYITITNGTREAAREGSIYVYDRSLTKSFNDAARNAQIRTTVLSSLNLLSTTTPQLTTGATWTQSGDTFTNGDLTVIYELPSGVTDSDARIGQRVTVRLRYHEDLLIPLIGNLLPHDAGGRLILTGEVSMVLN
ncbi:MAG: TadE/TadG family type IV pilus assembly protein [Candidatus Limnocylindrales bacterium]